MSDTAQALQTPPGVPAQYWPTIVQAAQQYGIRSDLLAGVLAHESAGWSADVISGARLGGSGEIGIAQFMPGTAAGLGVNPYDATSSINGAARYLGQGYRQGGSWDAALRYYNSGSVTGTPTAGYISSVLARMAPITDWLATNGQLPEATSPFSGPGGLPQTPGGYVQGAAQGITGLPGQLLGEIGTQIRGGLGSATRDLANHAAEFWNTYYPHIFLWTAGIGLLALGTFGLATHFGGGKVTTVFARPPARQ